jgi:hypothetical protein
MNEKRFVVALLVAGSGLALTARAEDAGSCPMHAQQVAQVDERHEHATGLPKSGVEHHFLTLPEGGTIRLEVKDATRTADRDRVRTHLKDIARAFAAGDFSMPTRIHAQTPPGALTMTARKDAIRYAFSETPRGGLVTIATGDPVALAAVHEFLRFQVADHATGDPVR